MGLFNRSAAGKLAGRTILLLPADPGPALKDAARLYDPGLRSWPDRLIFDSGVLLYGPVKITPRLAEQAGLPPGMAVAYYASSALQSHGQRRTHEAKQADGGLLVQALADRLGGTVTSPEPLPDPELTISVWSDQEVPAEQVAELLRPYDEADFKLQDQTKESYRLYGTGTSLMVSYWSPLYSAEKDAPPALGPLRARPLLRHWDLSLGRSRKAAGGDLAARAGEAALALAARCGGVTLDEYYFPVSRPGDLRPR